MQPSKGDLGSVLSLRAYAEPLALSSSAKEALSAAAADAPLPQTLGISWGSWGRVGRRWHGSGDACCEVAERPNGWVSHRLRAPIPGSSGLEQPVLLTVHCLGTVLPDWEVNGSGVGARVCREISVDLDGSCQK